MVIISGIGEITETLNDSFQLNLFSLFSISTWK